jgi:ribosomal protein L19
MLHGVTFNTTGVGLVVIAGVELIVLLGTPIIISILLLLSRSVSRESLFYLSGFAAIALRFLVMRRYSHPDAPWV